MYKFEDKIDVINGELKKRRYKWQLKARNDLDYEDVEQIIRIHIFNKWSLWDQSRPIEPWLNRTISRQISNLLRNLYGGFSRPCLKCAANQGGDLCALFTTQCSQCPLFAKWVKGKKQAHDVKIPLPLETHVDEVESLFSENLNYENLISTVNQRMKVRLNAKQYEVYDLLFVKNLSESEVAVKMGYKKNNDLKRKVIRYKQIENYKKLFLKTAKDIIAEEGLI